MSAALALVRAPLNIVKPMRERIAEAARVVVDAIAKDFESMTLGKDLEGISERLLLKGREITGAILGAYFESRAEDPSERLAHPCPHCGLLIHCREDRPRTIETRHGKTTFNRPYFYCLGCRQGFFPLDDDLRLAAKAKQHDLGRLATKFLIEMPYASAADIFKEATGLEFSDHCMHGLAEALGEQTLIEKVLPSKTEVDAIIEQESGNFRRPVVVVAADGAHEPCRPEGGGRDSERGAGYWREAKGFRIYLVTKNGITQIASWHQIMDEEAFGKALAYAATLIPQDKVRIGLVADGAPWLWPHLTNAFPDGEEILDYYHLSEHVHKVAEAQYGSATQAAQEWCEATIARLWLGEVGAVIWGMQRMKTENDSAAEEIRKFIGYLEKNINRIDYDSHKRGGYPIGSGGIESANKFICHIRIKRSGAWWYEHNANNMLRLRCAKFNGTLDRILDYYKVTAARNRRGKKKAKSI
jgi:hypothetical protein